jgi:hypothetical protein
MKVLHLYDTKDQLIAQHVAMLNVESVSQTSNHIDIIHVHGCWNRSVATQAERLRLQGARIVLSPHGALQPWIISERFSTEKAAKALLWQRNLVQHAFAVIAHGKMELDALRNLGWNPRIESIGNAVITNTITPEAMRRETYSVYQKVMDSYTLPLLSPQALKLLPILLKAGITGDKRWVQAYVEGTDNGNYFNTSDFKSLNSSDDWRRLLLYADHENIRQVVDRGISILRLDVPKINTADIACYLPQGYKQPVVDSADPVSIAQQAMSGPLSMLHLVELDRALRQPDIDDDSLAAELSDQSMTRYFQRLLQLLSENTLIEEGFMPLPPINDRNTGQMRRQLATHLMVV